MDLSVVIPVYGSEATLRPLTDRLRKVLNEVDRPWEIVFVDDNSPDRAWCVLEELQAEDTEHIELAQCILPYDLNFTFIDGLLMWCTQRVGAIPVAHEPRTTGRSGYSFRKQLTLALNMFTNFSLVPLQFVSLAGFVFALLGFLLG